MGNRQSFLESVGLTCLSQPRQNARGVSNKDSNKSAEYLELAAGIMIISDEVIYHNIFPHLEFNDLLRLRRVCQRLKSCAEAYICSHASSQEREITEKNIKSFGDYIRTNIPSKRLYLNTPDAIVFQVATIPKFSQLYAANVTYLRVEVLPTSVLRTNRNFFSTLKHLTHLEVTTLIVCENNNLDSLNDLVDQRRGSRQVRFYMNFQQLKQLKIWNVQCPRGNIIILHKYCPNLKYLMCSRYGFADEQEFDSSFLQQLAYIAAVKYVIWRQENYPDKPNLKYLDFQGCTPTGITIQRYLGMLRLFTINGVKVLNLNADFHRLLQNQNIPFVFDFPIVSMTNVYGTLSLRVMPYLEKLEITGPCMVSLLSSTKLHLSKLLALDITINEKVKSTPRDWHAWRVSIVDVLFDPNFGIKQNLAELKMQFGELGELPEKQIDATLWTFCFALTCKNLTTLTLVNWKGTGSELCILWKGLRLLENLEIRNCKTVGDYSFIGCDSSGPSFLNLTKLVKLTLCELDMMPGITDLVFENVFRHTKIKYLYLKSEKPIHSITVGGIRSLLTGQFADSVERFPFRDWSLDGVSCEEHDKLEKEFRSYYMT